MHDTAIEMAKRMLVDSIWKSANLEGALKYFCYIARTQMFIDAHVIIETRLEKPSKINGFALLSPIFLTHAGWREDGAVHINTYYTESQM